MSLTFPPAFEQRMRNLLGAEYEAFAESSEKPRSFGLRLNSDRISRERFEALIPFPVTPIPWIPQGYFYPEEVRPSLCPLYQAGLFYLQDPGAMTPAALLDIRPGDRVLDLCAAPGGKACAAASKLNGQGLLVANDISASRARVLLRNLEQAGTTNALVTNETPDRLARQFPVFFDRIILDVPCSGEGMFRKEESLLRDWSQEKSDRLAEIQRELLSVAQTMLKPGGLLMYSTCTYAPAEDEEAVASVLEKTPDLNLIPMDVYDGFSPSLKPLQGALRIYPHRMQAEGHFAALLEKQPVASPSTQETDSENFRSADRKAALSDKKKKKTHDRNPLQLELVRRFFEDMGIRSIGGQPVNWQRMQLRQDKVYYLPQDFDKDMLQLKFLRAGLYVGDLLKDRFEPAHQLALSLHRAEADRVISFRIQDERLSAYLKGEPVSLTSGEADMAPGSGWVVVAVEGYPLGFGKKSGEVVKNRVPKAWRV